MLRNKDGHVVGSIPQQEQNPDKYTLWNPLPAFPAVQNDPSQRNANRRKS